MTVLERIAFACEAVPKGADHSAVIAADPLAFLPTHELFWNNARSGVDAYLPASNLPKPVRFLCNCVSNPALAAVPRGEPGRSPALFVVLAVGEAAHWVAVGHLNRSSPPLVSAYTRRPRHTRAGSRRVHAEAALIAVGAVVQHDDAARKPLTTTPAVSIRWRSTTKAVRVVPTLAEQEFWARPRLAVHYYIAPPLIAERGGVPCPTRGAGPRVWFVSGRDGFVVSRADVID